MNSSTKIFSILSLSTALGNLMCKAKNKPIADIEIIKWRGSKLSEAGERAVLNYPLPTLTNSLLKQIEIKVEQVCKNGEDFSIVEKLAFLIAALIDIRAHIKPERWLHIDLILKRVKWCIEAFDPKYEQELLYSKALNDFERWSK